MRKYLKSKEDDQNDKFGFDDDNSDLFPEEQTEKEPSIGGNAVDMEKEGHTSNFEMVDVGESGGEGNKIGRKIDDAEQKGYERKTS